MNLPSQARDYLTQHHVMTLATQGADGPWAAAVFYAHEGASLYFLSAPATRHARNLAHDARCAATIQDDIADWAQVRGVQLEGRTQRLDGDAARLAHELYGRKFPFVANLARAPAAIALAFAKIAWYRLDAERVHLIDNSRGFGHRDSFELAPPR
ncbi:MAG: pyridoxamine 5'-phosphate oxidase family protein [Rhizobacter sp.]|nr:pyridoxamine 5'-phosphate oxidase family protein [Rhizobacter sp.]